ncbi:hypothetical protein LRS11_16130 [Pseudomonas sp. J452]|uniref:hypothetical protein n=1 Tax=Pseudomonas sp. J452 TaxID=2898441 RepID=UPI0021AD9217|nr:hypothetical protein [Pseudomonas sp. J452]UUY07341.1 hypothetical protein LRS11_16130 [Pseudomonas sp. J452]
MLKHLFATLFKSPLRPRFNPGYQTKIYPTLGEVIILHDSLDFGLTATDDQLNRITEFWKGDEDADILLAATCWSGTRYPQLPHTFCAGIA